MGLDDVICDSFGYFHTDEERREITEELIYYAISYSVPRFVEYEKVMTFSKNDESVCYYQTYPWSKIFSNELQEFWDNIETRFEKLFKDIEHFNKIYSIVWNDFNEDDYHYREYERFMIKKFKLIQKYINEEIQIMKA